MGCADRTPLTFSQLKPRLMNLLINALQVESDPQNTQMLLGAKSSLSIPAVVFLSII